MPEAPSAASVDREVKLLHFIGRQLAADLSAIAKNFDLTQDEMKSTLEPLVSRGLVKVQGAEDSPAPIYSLTQDGARKLENSVRGFDRR